MAAVRSHNTEPELRLRRALHARGLRYTTHPRDLPGRPDLANRGRKLAIFVDGDFWHANPDVWERRGMTSMGEQFPADRRAFWTQKLLRNMTRDNEVNAMLYSQGWQVIRVWESEIRANLDVIADRIATKWRETTPQ
jgi:DNA mismatch endonuclease (patch repair protein)